MSFVIFRHNLNLPETAMPYYIAAATDYLTTELVGNIFSTMQNRNKMVHYTAVSWNNKSHWSLEDSSQKKEEAF